MNSEMSLNYKVTSVPFQNMDLVPYLPHPIALEIMGWRKIIKYLQKKKRRSLGEVQHK